MKHFDKQPLAGYKKWKKKAEDATEQNRQKEQKRFSEMRMAWSMSPTKFDIKGYFGEFDRKFPGTQNHIRQKIADRKAAGKDILMVDLAGFADGESLGIQTISATLSTEFVDGDGKTTILKPQKGQTFVSGDLLTPETQKKLVEQIQAAHLPVSFIFFLPIAGVEVYEGNPYAAISFTHLLKLLYPFLEAGGEIFLDFSSLASENVPDLQKMLSDIGAIVSRKGESFRVTKPATNK